MTDRELMQMALDALQYIYTETTADEDDLIHAAINALRARLSQPEQAPTNNGRYLTGYKAHPEQEPVACEPQYENEDGWCDWTFPIHKGYLMQCCDCDLVHEVEFKVVEVVEVLDDGTFDATETDEGAFRIGLRMKRHYTKPQREWQGLTDKEIDEVFGLPIKLEFSFMPGFVRAIEAKLKDKNYG